MEGDMGMLIEDAHRAIPNLTCLLRGLGHLLRASVLVQLEVVMPGNVSCDVDTFCCLVNGALNLLFLVLDFGLPFVYVLIHAGQANPPRGVSFSLLLWERLENAFASARRADARFFQSVA